MYSVGCCGGGGERERETTDVTNLRGSGEDSVGIAEEGKGRVEMYDIPWKSPYRVGIFKGIIIHATEEWKGGYLSTRGAGQWERVLGKEEQHKVCMKAIASYANKQI